VITSRWDLRHRGRLPYVRALATGELLQYLREEFARCAHRLQIEAEDPTRTIRFGRRGNDIDALLIAFAAAERAQQDRAACQVILTAAEKKWIVEQSKIT
jgi:hypothetical protein